VIDNTVDPNTGTIKLKATFANEERVLWPGQFANVVLRLDTRNNAIVVPAEAVQVAQKGQIIFVVKADQTVEPRPVTVGPAVGKNVIIENGIAAGRDRRDRRTIAVVPWRAYPSGSGQQGRFTGVVI